MKREGARSRRVRGVLQGHISDGDRLDHSSEVKSEIHVANFGSDGPFDLPPQHHDDGKITATGGTTMVNDDHDESRALGHEGPLHVPLSPSKKQLPTPTTNKEFLMAMTERLRSLSMLQSDDIVFCLNHRLQTARSAVRSRNSLQDWFNGEFKVFDPGFPFQEREQGRLDHPKALPRHLLFIFNYENHWTLGHLDCSDRIMRHYDSNLSNGVDRWESIKQRMLEWTDVHRLVPEDTLQLMQSEKCPQQDNGVDCGIFAIEFAVGLITVGAIPSVIDPGKLRIEFAEQAQVSLARDEDNPEANTRRSQMSKSFKHLRNRSQASVPSTHQINSRNEGNSSSNRTPLPRQRNSKTAVMKKQLPSPKRRRIESELKVGGNYGNTESVETASRKVLTSSDGCMNNGLTPSPELQPTTIATQQAPQNHKIRQRKRNQGRQVYTHTQQLSVHSTSDNEEGDTATSEPLSLSTVIATPEFGDAWRAGDDCSLKLSDDEISRLPSGLPLSREVVDAALQVLGALDPINTVVVNSTTDKVIISPSANQTLLIPIHITQLGVPLDHWVLAAHNHSGIRLLDSLPSDTHTQLARQRIEMLYTKPPEYSTGQVENFHHATESRDSGVALLVNAIHTVAVSLGSRIEVPSVLNVALWRDVLTMILKMTTGETYHLPWADAITQDAVVWDRDETVNEGTQPLWYPSSSLVDPQLARAAIAYQQRYLDAQLKTLEAAIAKQKKQEDLLVRDAGSISSTLHSLFKGAITQQELVEAEEQRCTDALGTIEQLEAQLKESRILRANSQTSDEPCRFRKGFLEIQDRLAYRARALSFLEKCLKAIEELVSGLTSTQRAHPARDRSG